jgi:hypothetical protein
MNITKFWLILILMQIPIYLFFTSLQKYDISLYLFIFSICFSSSISSLLNFIYYSYKKNKDVTKKEAISIIIFSWFISLLLILPVLLFGYIILILFLAWFLFTIIFIGIKYVFKKEEDKK